VFIAPLKGSGIMHGSSYFGWFLILLACWVLSGPAIIAAAFSTVAIRRCIRWITGNTKPDGDDKMTAATPTVVPAVQNPEAATEG